MKILRSFLILILLLFFVPLISGYDYGVDLSGISSENDIYELAGEWDYDEEAYVDGEIDQDTMNDLLDLYNDPVDINKADRYELYKLPEVTYDLADKIIEYRDRYGSFERPEDIKKVPGVRDIYSQIEPFIKVKTKRVGGGCTTHLGS